MGVNTLSDGLLDKLFHLEHLYDSSYHSVKKIRQTFPSLINTKFFYYSDTFNRLKRMHAISSHKTQTALDFWKDAGLLKNRNGWQFVGVGGSSQFIATSCCNAPLCVVELVHSLEIYVISTYSSGLSVYSSQWTNPATHSDALQLVTMNYDETPSPTNCHPFLFFRCPTSFHK
jgi:capsule polysaccharide modification protein KpsS